MNFALTTRWNAHRHVDGEALIEEILGLGFDRVELGYDLRIDLVAGVKRMLDQQAVVIDTVHNFCPVPLGVPRGHPELWTLADPEAGVRRKALEHTSRTIRFAAEMGARAVVLHCGNVKMPRFTMQLFDLCDRGQQFSSRYEKTVMKMQAKRERKVGRQVRYLREGIERLLPTLEECGVRLALENLPAWESIPSEMELYELLRSFNSPRVGYWHDAGHAQVRQNLGLISQGRWLDRLSPWLVGMHLHSVAPPACDHLMPPQGQSDFTTLDAYMRQDIFRVLEPRPDVPAEHVREALHYFRARWAADGASTSPPPDDAPLDLSCAR